MDIKRLGRIPAGGGWRMSTPPSTTTRLAYPEVLPDEKDHTSAAFLHRAPAWFTADDVRVGRVHTANAMV
ncbi:MAG: hypothetical protein ABJA34_00525 [Pseudonocardiales bacterium]